MFVIPAIGSAFTLTTSEEDTFGQPPFPVTEYEIVAIPEVNPVTNPEVLTDATVEADEDHVPPAFPSVDNWLVWF